MKTENRVVVVGAGPAGMMAAIRASELGKEVILVEKNNTLGKKLLLSGKGRCNLTNACDLESFLEKFSKNGQFLRDAFKKFFNQDLMGFFEKRNLKLKTERQLRVFPVTDRSTSIVDVLDKELAKNKVKILYRASLKNIITQDNKVKGILLEDGTRLETGKLILATGGISYGFTGSTGEGIKLAKELGHKIIPLKPGLVPLEVKENYPSLLEGLTLKNVCLTFLSGNKELVSEIGELLFTNAGISGPLVISLSGQVVDLLEEKKDVFVEIDLKPALTIEQLDMRILREIKLNPTKNVKNLLKTLLPIRLIEVFANISGIDQHKKANQITQVERNKIVSLLKAFRLSIARPSSIKEAMVTKGGVSLKDISPRTMESRMIKGLYFAGEMIDVDADTGGFNLQAAFSTGYLAGESAALS